MMVAALTALLSGSVFAQVEDVDGGASSGEVDAGEARVLPAERGPSLFTSITDGLAVTGYAQAQYEMHQDSVEQLRQGSNVLNQDRFLLRRGRVRVTGTWEYAQIVLEVDGNTTRAPVFGFRKAEVSLKWRASTDPGALALMLTGGLFDVPFGAELVESPRYRPFMERSLASRALFPGEPDLGVRLSLSWSFLRLTAAVVNGEPIDEPSAFTLRDANKGKDIVFRAGVDTKPTEHLHVTGGLSGLTGWGFHAGSDVSKGYVEWRDLNEDGQVQQYELTPVVAASVDPSVSFARWATAIDAAVSLDWRWGTTSLSGELVLATNLDRGFLPADPTVLSVDARELGWHVRLIHEFQKWAVIGVRFDQYNPSIDFFDNRKGKLIGSVQTVSTVSPLIGFKVPHGRLYLQYDVIVDRLARGTDGVPSDLRNDTFTARLQVDL